MSVLSVRRCLGGGRRLWDARDHGERWHLTRSGHPHARERPAGQCEHHLRPRAPPSWSTAPASRSP